MKGRRGRAGSWYISNGSSQRLGVERGYGRDPKASRKEMEQGVPVLNNLPTSLGKDDSGAIALLPVSRGRDRGPALACAADPPLPTKYQFHHLGWRYIVLASSTMYQRLWVTRLVNGLIILRLDWMSLPGRG